MLMEDLIVESIQMMGHDVYFIPREELDNVDMIFGESTKVRFNRAYLIEAYIANVEGFEGDGDFFSKFGLEIRDTSNFILSRRSFARYVPTTVRERPQEGDLVWVPLMHRMFEVKFIEKKLMFFSVGNRRPFVYEMRCEDYRYNNEAIHTGIEEIDDVERENTYTIKFNIEKEGFYSQAFELDELVYQSSDRTLANATATGLVSKFDEDDGLLYVYETTGTFKASANVYGNTSGSIWLVTSKDDLSSNNSTYDFMSDADTFNADTTLILDLSEFNPFGTI